MIRKKEGNQNYGFILIKHKIAINEII